MNSSISNSEEQQEQKQPMQARKNNRRVIGGVLLFFLLMEVFTRTKLMRMSKDLVRFADYPAQAAALAQDSGVRVAFVGNSAVERGIDPVIVTAASEGLPFHQAIFLAHGSHINTWHYMLNRYFWTPGNHADLIVITFYERNMEDGHPDDIGRMAQFFTTSRDWGEVLQTDLPEFSHRTEFLLSSFWATYAVRDRLKERILGAITPDYKEFTQKVNSLSFHQEVKPQEKSQAASYCVLQRLLDTAKRNRTRLCFVAFPTYEPSRSGSYSLAPEMLRLIRDANMDFLDLRMVAGLTPKHYADDIHLTPEGAKIYTHALMSQLMPLLRSIDKKPSAAHP